MTARHSLSTPHSIECLDEAHGPGFQVFNGDCVEVLRQLPERSVDLQVFSPPFANLYTYSDSPRDHGNCANPAEFMAQYRFAAQELYRVLRPGRICAVHCKDGIRYKGSHGRAGLYDFPGDLTRVHEEVGFQYHGKVTIWKCPVTEMQRTKNHGLLLKQTRKDSTISRMGMAEYILYFRRWPDGDDDPDVVPVPQTDTTLSLAQWQEWASPVWMDIRQTNTLNCRLGREDQDEKHMCPLQLDVIERIVTLYSRKEEVVLSPYSGVGSEGVVSLNMGRRFVGVELKTSYFDQQVAYLREAAGGKQTNLFPIAV